MADSMLRVLVVEDENGVRALVSRVLSAAGHCVQTAPTPQEALSFVLYDLPMAPDVALVDIVLPGMSGFDYALALRRHFASVRIVFMTGREELYRNHKEAQRLGALLLKPFNRETLLAAIEAVERTGN